MRVSLAASRTGLVVHRAADLATLADALVVGLRETLPPDPMMPIDVVVQTGGVARWLRERIARSIDPAGRGIAANVRLPFLGGVIAGLVAATEGRSVVGPAFDAAAASLPLAPSEPDPWVPERSVWSVLDLLEVGVEGTERIAETLDLRAEGVLTRRSFELARSIADVLDHYVVHAPGLLRAWARGADVAPDGTELDRRDRWQPALWRALVGRLGDPVARFDAAVDVLASAAPLPPVLPSRLDLFGFEVVQERHLRLLIALGTRLPVHLHLVTASPARWEATAAGAVPPAPRHPLLVASGRAADRTIALVRGLDPAPLEVVHAASDHGSRARLLEVLRSGVREDVELAGPDPPAPHVLAPDDDSVRVHVCHGLTRQAEVLRDALLGLMDRHPGLEPRDILIVSPDVEAAAVALAPAFSAVGHGARLPIVVADREIGHVNEVGAVLEELLALVPSRVTASQVIDLLGRPVVTRALRLEPGDLARFVAWVEELGIRWGIDERHRARQGQPAERAHTWRAGLDRLLLGVAMADEDDRVVADVTPYDHTVGDEVDRAGRFVRACEAVFGLVEGLASDRSGPEWADAIGVALDTLVAVDPRDDWLAREVRAIVDTALRPVARRVDVGVVAGLLRRRLGAIAPASGYATGAVTLCAPIPLRSVPSRVVCLFGFDDATFPRRASAPGFDLVTGRPGGHEPRDEDRLLLLDAVLAARDHLVITTTGRDPRTNEVLPPAVPITELTDVLVRLVGAGPYRDVIEAVHPLQPWSPRAFAADARPPSFDPTHLAAARRVADPGAGPGVPTLLVGWDAAGGTGPGTDHDALERVRTSELASTLRSPLEAFLRSRLGVRVEDAGRVIDDEEPLELDGLDRYGVISALLRRTPEDRGAWIDAALGRQDVPAGTTGRLLLEAFADDADALVAVAEEWCEELGVATAPVASSAELTVAGRWSLSGSAELRLQDDAVLVLALLASRADSGDVLLGPWIEHLLQSAVSDVPVTTGIARIVGGTARVDVFDPLDADVATARARARELLAQLLALRERALHEPLPLFRRASYARAEGGSRGAARAAFLGDDRVPGDLDEVVELVTDAELLDDAVEVLGGWERFDGLANELWGPLVAALGAPR